MSMRVFGDEIIERIDPPTDPTLWWVLGIVACVAAVTVVLIVLLKKKKRGE